MPPRRVYSHMQLTVVWEHCKLNVKKKAKEFCSKLGAAVLACTLFLDKEHADRTCWSPWSMHSLAGNLWGC